ncbi:MAG: two-component sensor histidine kinase [Symbiobacteriaceae bacterium]|nr:two-component sensor histidine kinase [Symbiobacteriaceae bacterium]
MFRSIQSKLIIVYLLLVLVAMQLSMVYLLKQLERSYVAKEQAELHQTALLWEGQFSSFLVNGKLDEGTIGLIVANLPGDVLVLDGNGKVIGATAKQPDHKDLVGKKYSNDDITPALVAPQSVQSVGEDDTGERIVAEALPIEHRGEVVGIIYLRASLADVYTRLSQVRDTLLTAWAIALGSTATLGVVLARTITGPIREVTRKAAEMAGGNFDQTIAVRSSDEIGQLGDMFNRMTRRLKSTLDEIQGEKHKVEAILTHMADGLLALDETGRIIKLNPAAERMFRTTEPEVLGRHPADVWPDLGLESALDRALEETRSVTFEFRFGGLYLLAYITPLFGERQHVAGMVVVFHDITELEKLEALRREFVANVSHELKTPLTTVKSYVETLLDGAADEPELRTRFLRVVDHETDRMARLVKDLLHLSQLDQGSVNWDIHAHEIPPVVDDCVARLAVQIERKNLVINRAFAAETPLALVDRDKLQQVLLNLLANAVEFTPSGGQISIATRADGAMVRVSVADSGIGIPAEDLPRIFERFYRVDKARSRMLGGTGLGLAIARQIIELSGGAISIDSELGKGTEVVFTLPAAQVAETGWN